MARRISEVGSILFAAALAAFGCQDAGEGVYPTECSWEDPFDPEWCPGVDTDDARVRYVDGSAGASGDGSSWDRAFARVQDGIDACACVVGELGGRCQVWVAAGLYPVYLFCRTESVRLRPGVELYGGFAGGETALGQRDWAANETILDGGYTAYHVVIGADDATIDGFTIQRNHGRGEFDGDEEYPGGGMYNVAASPTVANCRFVQGEAPRGGGMYNLHSSPIVTGCVFESNRAYQGAGMYNDGSSPTVTGCLFEKNDGGAIFDTGSAPTITGCTLSRNRWDVLAGGGAAGLTDAEGSWPVISGCVIWNNVAWDGSVWNPNNLEKDSSYPTFQSSLVGGCGGSGAWDASCGDDLGGNLDADPLFADPDAVDYSLLPGSPCIDAGDNALLPADVADLDGDGDTDEPLPLDLAGSPRVVDGNGDDVATVDMGAYEYQP